jgi:hypothetical protein
MATPPPERSRGHIRHQPRLPKITISFMLRHSLLFRPPQGADQPGVLPPSSGACALSTSASTATSPTHLRPSAGIDTNAENLAARDRIIRNCRRIRAARSV